MEWPFCNLVFSCYQLRSKVEQIMLSAAQQSQAPKSSRSEVGKALQGELEALIRERRNLVSESASDADVHRTMLCKKIKKVSFFL